MTGEIASAPAFSARVNIKVYPSTPRDLVYIRAQYQVRDLTGIRRGAPVRSGCDHPDFTGKKGKEVG